MTQTELTYLNRTKILCEHILNDTIIQNSSRPLIMVFKTNITRYLLSVRENEENWKFNNKLVLTFADMTKLYIKPACNAIPDVIYISKLLKQNGLEDMNQQYKFDLEQFIKGKLYDEIKNFVDMSGNNNQRLYYNLRQWIRNMENCTYYNCAVKLFDELRHMLFPPKDDIFNVTRILRFPNHNQTVCQTNLGVSMFYQKNVLNFLLISLFLVAQY